MLVGSILTAQESSLTIRAWSADNEPASGFFILSDDDLPDSTWRVPLKDGLAFFDLSFVGIEPRSQDIDIKVFPNPSSKHTVISISKELELSTFKILNCNGRITYSDEYPFKNAHVETGIGMCLIQFTNKKGESFSKKLLTSAQTTAIIFEGPHDQPVLKTTRNKTYTLRFEDLTPEDPDFEKWTQQIQIDPKDQISLEIQLEYTAKDFFVEGHCSPEANGFMKSGQQTFGILKADALGTIPRSLFQFPFSKNKVLPVTIELFDEHANVISLNKEIQPNSVIHVDTLLSYYFELEGNDCSPEDATIEVYYRDQLLGNTQVSKEGNYSLTWTANQRSVDIDSVIFSRVGYERILVTDTMMHAGKNSINAQLKGKNTYEIFGFAVNETAEFYLDQGEIEVLVQGERHLIEIQQDGSFSYDLHTQQNIQDTIKLNFINHPDYTFNTFSILKQGVPASTGKITGGIHLPYQIRTHEAQTTLANLTDGSGIYLVAFSDSSAHENAFYHYLNGIRGSSGNISYAYDSITLALDTIRRDGEMPVSEEIRQTIADAFDFLNSYYYTPLGIRLVNAGFELGKQPESVEEIYRKASLSINSDFVPDARFYPYDSAVWIGAYGSTTGYGDMFSAVCVLGAGLYRGLAYLPPFTDFADEEKTQPLQTWYGKVAIRSAFLFPSGFFRRSYGDHFMLPYSMLNAQGVGTIRNLENIAESKLIADDGQIFDLYYVSNYRGSMSRELAIPDYYPPNTVFTFKPSGQMGNDRVSATMVQTMRNPIASALDSELKVTLDDLKKAGFYFWLLDSALLNNDTVWQLVSTENHLQWSHVDSSDYRTKKYTIVGVDESEIPIAPNKIQLINEAIDIFKGQYSIPFEIMNIEVDTIYEYPVEFEPGRVYIMYDSRIGNSLVKNHPNSAFTYNKSTLRITPNETLNGIILELAKTEGLNITNQDDLNNAFLFNGNQIIGLSPVGALAFRIANLFKGGSFTENDFFLDVTLNDPAEVGDSITFEWNILQDGHTEIFEQGICMAYHSLPTIYDSVVSIPYNTTSFKIGEHDLDSLTWHHFRFFISTPLGYRYSNEVQYLTETLPTFTDQRDGQEYQYIEFGDTYWMAENMAYMPHVNAPIEDEGICVYGFYGNDPELAKSLEQYRKNGCLYDYETALNVCPDGWSLPLDNDWMELESYLGMSQDELYGWNTRVTGEVGYKLRAKHGWPNEGGTNEIGFTALPSGYCDYRYRFLDGHARYWSPKNSIYSTGDVLTRIIYGPSIHRVATQLEDYNSIPLTNYYSVRCVKYNSK